MFLCNMFAERKGKIFAPLALVAFHHVLKREGENLESVGSLRPLHKSPICKHSWPVEPAYKALLGCACTSIRQLKGERYFLNENSYTYSVKSSETKNKKSLTAR